MEPLKKTQQQSVPTCQNEETRVVQQYKRLLRDRHLCENTKTDSRKPESVPSAHWPTSNLAYKYRNLLANHDSPRPP